MNTTKIRELNDAFRTTLQGGRVTMTPGIAELPDNLRTAVIARVVTFDTFDTNNDPHSEHDFGAFDVGDKKAFWKIDYYDSSLEYGSEDPADANATTRVLTIMFASEY